MSQIVTIPGQGEAEFPDDMPPEKIAAAIRKTFPVMDEKAKKAVPGSEGALSGTRNLGKTDETSMLDQAKGLGDAALTGLSGLTTGAIGGVSGFVEGIAGQVKRGDLGTQEGAARTSESVAKGAGDMTRKPSTALGQEYLEKAGSALDESGVMALGPVSAGVRAATRPAVTAAQHTIASKAQNAVQRLKELASKREPEMVGVGAAETDPAAMRRARAEALPTPIKLTKGQAERGFEQQQFERETAKHPTYGKPLRERYEEQNHQILANFDNWLDQTGGQAPTLRATGESVTTAIADKAKSVKGRVRAAYTKAREAGDMEERVDVRQVSKYLESKAPESINAGVITAAKQKLESVTDKKGLASINDIEEVRKMVGKLGGKDATNAQFAGEIKGQIDAVTEGKGGELYKQARAMHREYASEFKNVGLVNKLISNKPGTTDRKIAFEDVFQKTVSGGSVDDLRMLRKTLQTGGEKGQQAWRDLQGATVQHLKDEITSGVATDQGGNPIVSPAKLNRLVSSMDKEGKLDLLFGKKGAEQLREVNQIAKDIYTAPPGSVNTSNTASIIIAALDKSLDLATKIPYAGPIAKYAGKKFESVRTTRRVKEALQQPEGQIPMREAFDAGQSEPIPMKKAVGE